MNPFSLMISLILDLIAYKGKPGEIIWWPSDVSDRLEVHGYLIHRTSDGPVEIPYHMANKRLVHRPTGGMVMSIFSQAIEEGMKPVAVRIGDKIVSPYSKVTLRHEDIWPASAAHAA